ncbi:MAG TPA: fructose bisphosphate aldolase [Acidimicrobiales bacterium]|nr:fructose bisphosphate aldolase [Acidimicrobiales bacterium]
MNDEQFQKIKSGRGFIAALDQSGGSTPKALLAYGIPEDAYSDDDEMFALMHEMRSRLITSPSFSGDRVIGAILFEDTLGRDIEGRGSADYLWNVKNVVPFIKVDKGLADEANGVQVMKPMPELDALLDTAIAKGVFGTKMRSFIKLADEAGIKAIVTQQFEIAHQILAKGLVPIVEPEIDIHSPEKAEAERLLKADIFSELGQLSTDQHVMVKISLPEQPNFYTDLMQHPNVLRVVALSGGYSRQEADTKLTANHGLIASFSRALTEGLTVNMTDKEFDDALDKSIASIYAASLT